MMEYINFFKETNRGQLERHKHKINDINQALFLEIKCNIISNKVRNILKKIEQVIVIQANYYPSPMKNPQLTQQISSFNSNKNR
jgi:hypothetical protein